MSHEFWMIVSGITGAICFVIVHFTKLLKNKKFAASLQLCANTFVFISFGSGYLAAAGPAKLIPSIGTIMPVIFGSITVWRVFIKKI